MRARPLYRFAVLSSALALPAVLAACLGGTGTDTENGLSVRNASDAPMANVRVQVRSVDATPDSAGIDPVVGGSENLVTDSNGSVRFIIDRPGKFLVEGRRGDTVLFIDTLRAPRAKPQTIIARTPVRLRGRIRLLSGFRADTGLVFVRGTGLSSVVNGDGSYDLGWGPSDALGLTVGLRYAATPASHAIVKMAARNYTGKVLSILENMTQTPSQQQVFARDSIILFKAAPSGSAKSASHRSGTCLDQGVAAVTPAYSAPGSIHTPDDVIRETGVACGGHAGAVIEAQSVNASGAFLAKIETFVMPDTLAWGEGTLGRKGGYGTDYPVWQRAILAECIRSASEGVSYRTTVKANGEVRVDDVIRGINCLAETPQP